jgi:hypothetical protein
MKRPIILSTFISILLSGCGTGLYEYLSCENHWSDRLQSLKDGRIQIGMTIEEFLDLWGWTNPDTGELWGCHHDWDSYDYQWGHVDIITYVLGNPYSYEPTSRPVYYIFDFHNGRLHSFSES